MYRFQPPLTGGEILLEATGRVNNVSRTGIWSYDPESKRLRLLIDGARSPLWNPQHTLFAFIAGRSVYVCDRSGKCTVAVDQRIQEADNILCWSPDGETLLLSIARIAPLHERDGVPVAFASGVASAQPGGRWLTPFIRAREHLSGLHVGRTSFSPDGKMVAFEVFRAVPGIGRTESRIAVSRVEDGRVTSFRRLTQLPSSLFELNPHWSPDGRHIALDVVDPRQQLRVPCVVKQDGSLLGFLIRSDRDGGRVARLVTRLPDALQQEMWTVWGWVSSERIAVLEKPLVLDGNDKRTGETLWLFDIGDVYPPIYVTRGAQRQWFLLSPDRRLIASLYDLILSLELLRLQGAVWCTRVTQSASAISIPSHERFGWHILCQIEHVHRACWYGGSEGDGI